MKMVQIIILEKKKKRKKKTRRTVVQFLRVWRWDLEKVVVEATVNGKGFNFFYFIKKLLVGRGLGFLGGVKLKRFSSHCWCCCFLLSWRQNYITKGSKSDVLSHKIHIPCLKL